MQPNLTEFFTGRRSQLWILGVVAILALVAANVAWLFPTLDETETNAYVLHRTIALNIRNQVSTILSQHEKSLEDASDILNQQKTQSSEIISRLMKENQAFESISLLDLDGIEVSKNHRFLLITKEDLKNRSQEELFKVVSEGMIYRGAVKVSGTSEPITTIAIPLRRESGFSAIVAEINLKFLLDVVRSVNIGNNGDVYIVDEDGYIIAHPNSSLVFGRVNVINRKIIVDALSGKEADTRDRSLAYKNENGQEMLVIALPFDPIKWAVVVENQRSIALASSQRIFSAALVSFGLEILLLLLLVWNYFNLIKTAALFYEEKNQREAILNSLSDGVIEYDDQSRIILMNPKAEELLGIRFGEINSLPIKPDSAESNSKLKSLVEIMYPALAAYASGTREIPGTQAKTMEVHISSPELKLLVTITKVIGPDGKVKGFLKILHDISREKLLGRMKSEFVSIAAHQLRTPLSAIKWTLKLLLDGDAGELSAQQNSFLAKGYEINERMIKLVNDLLSAARIEEGRFGYDFADIDLEEFIKRTVVGYADLSKRKNIELKFEQAQIKLPFIYADIEKLTLVLNNLLDNAMKYTPAGGKVIVTLNRQGNFALVSIADNGVGVPQEEQKRLFTKFFRASNVVRMDTEGTGLGLFIVRNIIKRHGGDIGFNSVPGKGSTFTFMLPLKRELVPREEKPELEEFLGLI